MSRGKVGAVACFIAAALATGGCYGRRLYEIEYRLDSQERRIGAVEDSLGSVAGVVAQMDSAVGYKSVPTRTSAARIESRMDDMHTRLEIIEALVKENRYKISQLSSGPFSQPGPGDTAGVLPDSSRISPSVAQHLYETSYVDFVRGNFEPAIDGFRDFLGRYPANEYSDDAQFMIGQSFYVLGDYASAIVEFRKVLDGYPSGDKVPQAMYNLGLSYLKLDDPATAREYFRILTKRYPSATEANQARTMLESMGQRDSQ